MASFLKKYPVRLVALGIFWLALAWSWNSGQIGQGPVICWFRLLTHHPCPFCGSTRAVAAFCAGEVSAALSLNPMGVALFCVLALTVVVPVLPRTAVRGAQRVGLALNTWMIWAGAGMAFVSIWAWNITTRW